MAIPAPAKILLKTRPTTAQLANRLANPRPEGLELYLDRSDLLDSVAVEAISTCRREAELSADFVWIVEAPIRTLGDRFFDLTNDDDDHRETLRRVIAVGEAIGAVAANVHVVAPTLDSATLSDEERRRRLEQTSPLLTYYVDECRAANLLPQVENVPPVGRMREGAYVYSSIGAAPADLLALADLFPSLRFTLDTSHAGLYLNWCAARIDRLAEPSRHAATFYQSTTMSSSLEQLANTLAPWVSTVHISNASELLGEGLAYGDGDFDLDQALSPLQAIVPYFVTETLESDPGHARGMREVQTRLLLLRKRHTATGAIA